MSHFAKVVNGIVETVIVAEQDFIDTLEGTWIQTSYNTRGGVHYNPVTGNPTEDQSKALRKNYAGIGYAYDSVNDAFIPPKPTDYPSFVLDPFSFTWVPPVSKPEGYYMWNETDQVWVSYTPNEIDLLPDGFKINQSATLPE